MRTLDERSLTIGVLRLARAYRRAVDKALAAHGVSEARALPVLHLARLGDGVRQGALADELDVEGPSLVRTLDQLCAAGLVERRGDPEDKRVRTLHLTDSGRALAATVETTLDEFRAKLLARVGDKDLGAALRVLNLFRDAIDAEESSPPADEG